MQPATAKPGGSTRERYRESRFLVAADRSIATDARAGRNPRARSYRSLLTETHRRGGNLEGLFYRTGHGSSFQMSAAYSAIVRSLENFPALATFRMAF